MKWYWIVLIIIGVVALVIIALNAYYRIAKIGDVPVVAKTRPTAASQTAASQTAASWAERIASTGHPIYL